MVIGLPGRVFLGRLPEWTPDVRYFSSEEYPRVNFAQRYDVRGTLALPVFERGSQASLGVVEVVMTTQNIDYHPELENICNALQCHSGTREGKSVLHPASLSLEFQEQESEEYNVTSHWDPAEVDLHSGKPRIENAGNETEKSRQNQRKLSG